MSVPCIDYRLSYHTGMMRHTSNANAEIHRRTTAAATQIVEQTQDLGHRIKDAALLKWEELEHWQRDNEYIHGNYRTLSNSYRDSFKTVFALHNQTVNIHSHLLGAITFVIISCCLYQVYTTRYRDALVSDLVIFGIFLAGVIACFVFSACFHVVYDHSDHVHHTWLVMDFIGILCLIMGSFLSGVFYGFYCKPVALYTYSIMASL